MKTLHLVLKHKWYDMIESGEKNGAHRTSLYSSLNLEKEYETRIIIQSNKRDRKWQ